jgi:hypothetical protein
MEGNAQMMHPPPPQQSYSQMAAARGPPTHHRHVITNAKATAVASAFQQVKSPISQCIDTIIGAAEHLEKRDPSFGKHKSSKSSKKGGTKRSAVPRKPSFSAGNSNDPLELRLEDETLHKKLILTMALQRPRQPKDPHPTKVPSRIIAEGFYWKEYPILEDVLYEHMEEYYEWSTRERQSKHQQAFNNALVEKVRNVGYAQGNQFDPVHFTDKRLRDRIRCFYKTHLQNAKKRLGTLLKHLHSEEHRASIEALIEQAEMAPKFENRLIAVISTSDNEEDDDEDDDEAPKRKRARST